MSESKQDDMTKHVALFTNLKYGYNSVIERVGDDENFMLTEEYARVSEWLSVTFTPLSAEGIAGSQLVALNKLRAKTVDEFKEKLDFIDGRIANLRALTGPTGAA